MTDIDFEHLRKDIDGIDNQILKLLNERMEFVQQIGKLKQKTGGVVYRPDRERAILDRLKSINEGPLKDSAIDTVFWEIFSVSRNLQQIERVAYLGPEGSFTHEAAENRFGAMTKYLPMGSIKSIFEAVESGHAKYAVAPIENKITGIIGETVDLLGTSPLKIIAEISIPIHLVFATSCEEIDGVGTVYSKDIVFQECKDFLDRHGLRNARQIPVQSTSKGASLVAGERDSAAICSKMAANLYHLPILHHEIENCHSNKTRFVILGDFESEPTEMDKTSILADLSNSHRGLTDLMYHFARADISLIRIDSRPTERDDDFTHQFYMEFEGHCRDRNVRTLLDKHREMIRWLGSYPKDI